MISRDHSNVSYHSPDEYRRNQAPRKRSPDAPNVKQYWYCGGHLFFAYGTYFQCFDISDNIWKGCWALFNGNYQCYDWTNGKWEWPNFNERDGTADGSHLTSIYTDGRLYTSPSVKENHRRSLTPSHDSRDFSNDRRRKNYTPDVADYDDIFDDNDYHHSDRSIDEIKA
jgi:hypothetical protein